MLQQQSVAWTLGRLQQQQGRGQGQPSRPQAAGFTAAAAGTSGAAAGLAGTSATAPVHGEATGAQAAAAAGAARVHTTPKVFMAPPTNMPRHLFGLARVLAAGKLPGSYPAAHVTHGVKSIPKPFQLQVCDGRARGGEGGEGRGGVGLHRQSGTGRGRGLEGWAGQERDQGLSGRC